MVIFPPAPIKNEKNNGTELSNYEKDGFKTDSDSEEEDFKTVKIKDWHLLIHSKYLNFN